MSIGNETAGGRRVIKGGGGSGAKGKLVVWLKKMEKIWAVTKRWAVGGGRWGGGFQVCALLVVEERWKGSGKGRKYLNKGLNMKLAVFGHSIPASGLVFKIISF